MITNNLYKLYSLIFRKWYLSEKKNKKKKSHTDGIKTLNKL